ncbi:hypothetical protein NVP1151O_31 [Vibrio phage 1.151.O._10N.222.46.B1]|nr:hypothetical protein NVP1151O_31 [Vibrio phage 1.151.O._10N.222.46.B1]
MSINFKDMTPEELITPQNYFGGNRFMKSDRPWIVSQLILLTLEQKKHACEEYREIYLRKGRKEANTHLKNYVDSNGSGDNVNPKTFASGRIPEALQARIERIKAGQSKKTILGMADK